MREVHREVSTKKKKTARELWVGERRNKPGPPLSLFVSSLFSLPLFMLRSNSKYQSKGPIYIRHLLAFAAIKFMYVGRQKPGFGKAMKKSAGGGIFVKKSGNVESGSTPTPTPLPDPDSSINISTEER